MEDIEEVLFVRSNQDNGVDESSTNEDDAWDDTVLIEAYDNAVSLAKDEVMRRMGLNGIEASPLPNSINNPVESKTHSHHKKWNKTKKKLNQTQWAVGDPCRCVYVEDGLSYEACIIQVNPTGMCVVKYVGYDNEEEVDQKSLYFSHGHAARLQQAEEARAAMEYNDSGNNDEDIDQKSTVPHNKSKANIKQPKNSNVNTEPRSYCHGRSHDKSRPATRHYVNQPHFSQSRSMSPQRMMFPPPPPPHILASQEFVSDSDALSNMLMSWYMSGFHTGFYQGVMQSSQQRGSKCNCCPNKH